MANHPGLVSKWEEEVSAWELNPQDESIPCPFDLPESGKFFHVP